MQSLNLFNLSGKTALVTGCDTGLGMGMATALAEAGADIIGASIEKDYSDVKHAVEATGRKFTYHQLDISDSDALYAFVNTVKKENERIDILVNNVGINMRKPTAEHSDEYRENVVNINLNAQLILAREFGKHMINNGGGKIIFTNSLLSFQGGINVPGYTAIKSAIDGLVRAYENEWCSKGVCVNGIAPGYIATNNTQALREEQTGVNQSWIVSLSLVGACLTILKGRLYFLHRQHQIM